MMNSAILLVDDDEIVLNALKRALSKSEYDVLVASNAEQGLEILEKANVHVVLSDQRMPGTTGSEFLKKVKQKYPHIITILLSAHADFDAIKDAINHAHIYKFLSKPWDNSFLFQQVQEAMIQYEVNKAREIESQKAFTFDKLTDLPNRASFVNEIFAQADQARNSNKHVGVLIADLDRFGNINNRFGQYIGDQILKSVAERLRVWAAGEFYVARVGNDEFGILLNDISQTANVKVIAKNIETILKEPFIISERLVYITFSIGVSLYPQDCNRCDALIEKANIALTHAKNLGGGLCRFYDVSMENETDVNLIFESEVYAALDQNQFVNFYQPIFSIETGKVVGVEALLRWEHPIRGLLMPDEFLPMCEVTGLIMKIDNSVFKKAINDFKIFAEHGLSHIYVSSNFSTRHFLLDDFPKFVFDLIEKTKIPCQNVVIEVTETLLVQESDKALSTLETLHRLGVRLALDDYGSGYSSLNYLKKYPFDILKIDKSYIREIGLSKNDEVLLSAMINMGKSLGQKVVAEGVETQVHLNFLKEKGCDLAQGYLFSKPCSLNDLINKLTSSEFTRFVDENTHPLVVKEKKA